MFTNLFYDENLTLSLFLSMKIYLRKTRNQQRRFSEWQYPETELIVQS